MSPINVHWWKHPPFSEPGAAAWATPERETEALHRVERVLEDEIGADMHLGIERRRVALLILDAFNARGNQRRLS